MSLIIKIIHVGNLEDKVSKRKVQVFPTHHADTMILTGRDMPPTLREAASKMAYLALFFSHVTFFHKPSACY